MKEALCPMQNISKLLLFLLLYSESPIILEKSPEKVKQSSYQTSYIVKAVIHRLVSTVSNIPAVRESNISKYNLHVVT